MKKAWLLCTAISVMAFAAPVAAQSTGAPASDDIDDAEAGTDVIVVTAAKRVQDVIDVPIAIATISGDELEQRGIGTVSDLQFAVPGMTMREDGPGSNTIFLRGIVNQYGNGAVVGQYLDELPMTLTAFDQLDVRAHDLERVEVLKGPQGTLYGQGSVAGTVRYITKKPVLDAFEGSLAATLSAVDGGDIGWGFENVMNLPIVEDKLGLRIASRVEGGGGWQDQPAAGIKNGNDQKLVNIRAKALWRATDRLDVEVMYIFHRNKVELGLGYENPDRTVFVAGDPSTVLVPKIQENHIGNLTLTADLGFATLTSATSYIDNDHQYPFAYQCGLDTNCDPFEGNDDRFDTGSLFTQEVRLATQDSGPLQWTVGFFYADLKDNLIADYRTFDASSETPFVSIFTDRFVSEASSESYALFGDVSYQLTDRLQVGVGGRYFHDKQKTASTDFFFLVPDLTEQSGSFEDFSPRGYVKYDISDTVNFYASVGSGFRSGGFNSPGDPPYEPENVLTYEAGIKGRSADGGITFELAGFFNDYSDMLRRGLVFNGLNFTSQLSNIGDVEIIGLEGGISVEAAQGLTLSATGAWIDTEVKAIDAADATNLPGDALDYVPEISFSISGHYEFDWSADMPGFARIDYSYRDKVSYIDRTTFDVFPQFSDSIGLLNARIGVEVSDVSVELFATNITNENKWLDPYHQWRNANRTRPRTVGVKVGMDF
ncbi:TonB-dependent receptor [Pacificimonas sp. WHA3]|uniref:TonB-dependent receptor n=1 Tax=Pacificimonas pallii TaxID=2827236 RepID=A0ABS6SA94_9SPHN|nr:TonB-dependent receptor [Pacificimonas pallii]MBV7255292.1 TonB-dependent receptor [Pacificimonas pallii]